MSRAELEGIQQKWIDEPLDSPQIPVKVIDWRGQFYYCAVSTTSAMLPERVSAIKSRLDLKGKSAVYKFIKRKDPAVEELSLGGWQSLNPVVLQGKDATGFGCVPSDSVTTVSKMDATAEAVFDSDRLANGEKAVRSTGGNIGKSHVNRELEGPNHIISKAADSMESPSSEPCVDQDNELEKARNSGDIKMLNEIMDRYIECRKNRSGTP